MTPARVRTRREKSGRVAHRGSEGQRRHVHQHVQRGVAQQHAQRPERGHVDPQHPHHGAVPARPARVRQALSPRQPPDHGREPALQFPHVGHYRPTERDSEVVWVIWTSALSVRGARTSDTPHAWLRRRRHAASSSGSSPTATGTGASSSSRRIRVSAARHRQPRSTAPTKNADEKPSTSASGRIAPDAIASAVRGRRDRRQHGDPERAADLLRGVDQPGRQPGLGRLHAGQRGDRDRHEREADPDADHQEARQQVASRRCRRPTPG